jgi:hypothetical protein
MFGNLSGRLADEHFLCCQQNFASVDFYSYDAALTSPSAKRSQLLLDASVQPQQTRPWQPLMALQIQSASFPGGPGSTIVQGVTVEPYVVVRRGDSTATCSAEDVPEDGTGDSRYSLRFRWYRSVVNRGGSVCWVHNDREATLQCVLCLRAKAEVRKSFHCSTDCLRRHWGLHKELHGQNNRFSSSGELRRAA